MEKIHVQITYSPVKGLIDILVGGKMLDISSILGKEVADWFVPQVDRNNWKGLIEELRGFLEDGKAEFCFSFFGPEDAKRTFERCLRDKDIDVVGGPSAEERAADCFQNGKNAERLGNDAEALRCFKAAAVLGHREARFLAGEYLLHGKGTKADPFKAVGLYKEAAELGHAEAMYTLGRLFFEGRDIRQDLSEAAVWFEKAAGLGHKEAQYYAGVCCEEAGRQEQAAQWYGKAAEQGQVSAQVRLGRCLEKGIGTQQDSRGAFLWYKSAAERGDSEGQFLLSRCCAEGTGTKKDEAASVKWLIKAAKQRHSMALYLMGSAFESGYGNLPKDPSQAVYFYRLAAAENISPAMVRLGKCYYNGAGVEQNIKKARELFENAAKSNEAEAQLYLGHIYFKGGKKNLEKAVKWYRKAAEQGNAEAQSCLAKCYKEGHGVEKNMNLALHWYRNSAAQGYAPAHFELAEHEYNEHIAVGSNILATLLEDWKKRSKEFLKTPAGEEMMQHYKSAADGGVKEAGKRYGELKKYL